MKIPELNLTDLKVGDEIVTIRPKGKRFTYGGVRILTEFDERLKRWRYAVPTKMEKNVGAIPPNGFGKNFMSKNPNPDFFYSANPIHIKAAKRQAERIRIQREKDEAEQARRMALALPIGDLLKTEYYDSEECYRLDTTTDIAEELVKRLTDEQIMTLRGWLGV